MKSFRVMIATALMVIGAAPGAHAVTLNDAPIVASHAIDDEEECLEAVPAETSVAGVTDSEGTVVLDILVLLNGVSLADGQRVMERAATAYEPLDITFNLRYESIYVPADTVGGGSLADNRPAITANRLIELSKNHVGGRRPAGTDIVYTMTAIEIAGGTAGKADCIGGVRYPNRAFAIGEYELDNEPSGFLHTYLWASSKIAAHEIGHLLGAHHHYANCVEGVREPTDIEYGDISPCTLMFNESYFLSLWFSTANSAIVRGHAVEFAD